MYTKNHPVLFVEHHEEQGFASSFELLPSNGTIVRTPRGVRLSTVGKMRGCVEFLLFSGNDVVKGAVSDKVLADRIVVYMEQYYGSHVTNCSAFAQYLYSGTFIECEHDKNFAVVMQGMRPYALSARVDVGDVVCLLYAKKEVFLSRRSEMRSKFVKAQNRYHRSRDFTATIPMKTRVQTPANILELCTNPLIDDYHYMVCVGHSSGRPIWLFQNGYKNPGENDCALAITIGEVNPYPKNLPLFSLIKKRR